MRIDRLLVLVLASCAAAPEPSAQVAPVAPKAAEPPPPPPAPPEPPPRVLPFDPSPEDRPHIGCAGFAGTRRVKLADGSEHVGPVVHGVIDGSGLAAAGVVQGEVIVGIAGTRIGAESPDPIGRFRDLLDALPPDSESDLDVVSAAGELRTVRVRLGRRPPPFARLETPDWWMTTGNWPATDARDPDLDALVAAALALDGGEARFEDTLARNRRAYAKRDAFRLRWVTAAHMNPTANENLAWGVIGRVRGAGPAAAAWVAAEREGGLPGRVLSPSSPGLSSDLDGLATQAGQAVDRIRHHVARAFDGWSEDERQFFATEFGRLTERLKSGEYVADDEDPSRERSNRRLVALLARVDPLALVSAAEEAEVLLRGTVPSIREAARRDGRAGLLASCDTRAGRVEIWGGGNDRHTTRCAFLFDLAGDDTYHDVAGRADPTQRVSIYVDASGDDLWAATSDFGLCGALGGVAVVRDESGDDQYLSRTWSQAAAVAGYALLDDLSGNDLYHAQDVGQGVALAGGAVLRDTSGDDLYTGVRFCQGVGFPGGVGALLDWDGNDRYVCTGRYDSEYGEPGLFSGWGQGCGFGFRHVASGGIGVLDDAAGDDDYEAGNFSQGGGYFYAWGILHDGDGNDRYVGSRYAQGFAAHQAVGTFLEDDGDDLYQSHSTVAQGLSWDETSVYFRDRRGHDRYQTAGFSLASAAHNGMVIFVDDGGGDTYAALPAHAGSNEYHGGHSFALFADRGGKDDYAGADVAEWNSRAAVRDSGAYFLDLSPGKLLPLAPLLR